MKRKIKNIVYHVFIVTNSKFEFEEIRMIIEEKVRNEISVDVIHLQSNFGESKVLFHKSNVIVCTANGVNDMNVYTIGLLKNIAENTATRIYLLGSVAKEKITLIEDFVQRIENDDEKSLSNEEVFAKLSNKIINFIKDGYLIARKENLLNIRDRACIFIYQVLKKVWDISYVMALVYAINISYYYTYGLNHPWMIFVLNNYTTGIGTFLAMFFCTHSVATILRNFLFGFQLGKGDKNELFSHGIVFSISVLIVFSSAIGYDKSFTRIFISIFLSFLAYWLFFYSRRIRAECSSLSEIFTRISDTNKRDGLTNLITSIPIHAGAFPLKAKKSGVVFISNMHKSTWSSTHAAKIYQEFTSLNNLFIHPDKPGGSKKYEVFLDREAIPIGGLWRRHLLRAISECNYFIVLLDDPFLESQWVLAESVYAALLRKNIAKPMILLVFKDEETMENVKKSIYGRIYKDIFEIPEHAQLGSGILISKDVDRDKIIYALEKMRPMQLIQQ